MEKKKVLTTVLIILLVILVLAIGNLVRKTSIIYQYSEKSKQYATNTNFYMKMDKEDSQVEIWRKGEKAIYKEISKDGTRTRYFEKNNNWLIHDIVDENQVASKIATKSTKEEAFQMIPKLGASSITTNNLWEAVKIAFSAKITTQEVNDIACYKIQMGDNFEVYVRKDNYLKIKETNGSIQEKFIEYRLDQTTDENVKLPDLTGYQIQEEK